MSKIKSFNEFIRESIWSDIQDRSSGDVVRKEDNIDNLDRNGFYEYLETHYEPVFSPIHFRIYNDLNLIYAPVFGKERGPLPRETVAVCIEYGEEIPETTITIGANQMQKAPDIEKLIRNHFYVVDVPGSRDRGAYIKIYPNGYEKNIEITNSFFLKFIDFLLNVAEGKYTLLLKKK